LGNSIFKAAAANIATSGTTTVASLGYNLSSDAFAGFLNGTGDQVNTDPMLGPLKDNAGPTKTHAPLIDSPAIDQGKDIGPIGPAHTATGVDQRGSVRPVNDPDVVNAIGGDGSDIGAVELAEFVHPTDAASRKTHGGAGDFDVVLPLTGTPGIECRGTGAATNPYKLIVNFADLVTVEDVQVISGTGTVSSFMVTSAGEGSAGIQVTINLIGVTDIQTLTVALFGVDDGTSASDVGIRARFRIADVTANDLVNSSDVISVKAAIGSALDTMNFRNDVNANGVINSSDVTLTKSKIP
jgi:hypothetical protein